MRKYFIIALLSFVAAPLIFSQTKQVTVEEVYADAFKTKGLDELISLNNGKQYTVLNIDEVDSTSSIDKYDYDTLEKVETIVDSKNLSQIHQFTSYEFSKDESKLLLATEVESIFRRSTLGVFYVYG
ncbi:MAG: S9 family peptidase, partial [Pricia sp.]|nr:S9 family peptidase [Pricia sp.]